MKDVIDVLELQGQRDKTNRIPIDYRKYDNTSTAARFIFEIGLKMNCKPQTITAAAYIFHRFCRETNTKNYDIYLIGSTSLFIASKIRDEPLKIRDVINVSHNTLQKDVSGGIIQKTVPPLELNDQYWAMRDAIVQAELLIIRMIKFQLSFPDPQKFLLQYYITLKGWLPPRDLKGIPLLQNALRFLNHFYHDGSVINYKPEHLAIASLFLSLQCHGISIPNTNEDDGLSWFTVFDPELTRDKVWEIAERIMDCYDKEISEDS